MRLDRRCTVVSTWRSTVALRKCDNFIKAAVWRAGESTSVRVLSVPPNTLNRKCRLILSPVLDGSDLCLEFGHQYMRAIKDGALALEQQQCYLAEIATPYAGKPICSELNSRKAPTCLLLVHPAYLPKELRRYAHATTGNWLMWCNEERSIGRYQY